MLTPQQKYLYEVKYNTNDELVEAMNLNKILIYTYVGTTVVNAHCYCGIECGECISRGEDICVR